MLRLDLSYGYNRSNSKGSINGKTGQLTNIVNNLDRNKDRVYEFDTLGRLTTAKGGIAAGAAGVTANWTQNYGYDRFGNRETVTATGVTQNSQPVPADGVSYTTNKANNRITTAGYGYDLAGNLVRSQKEDGSWQVLEYDAAGRLVVVKKETDNWVQQVNGYGSSRQRTYSWSFAGAYITFYVWGGSSVIAEYNGQGSTNVLEWAKSYIYAGSRLLSTFSKDGANEKLEFHHPDRLGTKLVTNNTANTSYEQSTLPFGTALTAESTGFSNQAFTSYDRSSVASLDYAVNRSYSSGQGRFTSVDPIGMGATDGSPQSLNLYAYTQNNPIDFIDPSGLNMSSAFFICYDVTQFGHRAGTDPNDENYSWTRTTTVCFFFGGGGGTGGNPGTDLDNGGNGGGADTPIPQAAIDDVVKRATTGECGDYVKRFLAELRKLGVKLYENGDITKIANRSMKSRTISETDLDGKPWGSRGGDSSAGADTLFGGSNRRIKIRRSTEGTQATLDNPNFTTTLLHETLHHASVNGMVSDKQFAEAAAEIARQDGTLTEKLKDKKELKGMSEKQKVAYYGGYAQRNFFNRHCKGQ